jgi:hypothetical protein
LTWLSSAGCGLSVAIGLATHFGYFAPAHAQQKLQLEMLSHSSAERASAAERALAAELRTNEALNLRLRQLERQPSEPAPAAGKPPPAPQGGRPIGGKTGNSHDPPPPPCVDDGDPLSGCLGSGRRRR